jgi:hypothetical protein
MNPPDLESLLCVEKYVFLARILSCSNMKGQHSILTIEGYMIAVALILLFESHLQTVN